MLWEKKQVTCLLIVLEQLRMGDKWRHPMLASATSVVVLNIQAGVYYLFFSFISSTYKQVFLISKSVIFSLSLPCAHYWLILNFIFLSGTASQSWKERMLIDLQFASFAKKRGIWLRYDDNQAHLTFKLNFRRVQTTPKVSIQKEEVVFSVEVLNTWRGIAPARWRRTWPRGWGWGPLAMIWRRSPWCMWARSRRSSKRKSAKWLPFDQKS